MSEPQIESSEGTDTVSATKNIYSEFVQLNSGIAGERRSGSKFHSQAAILMRSFQGISRTETTYIGSLLALVNVSSFLRQDKTWPPFQEDS